MAYSNLGIGLSVLLFVHLITSVISAEVRFYTVGNPSDEGLYNNSISSVIRNLITSARSPKVEQKNGDQETQISIQCQSLHKLFKKYKRQFNSDQSMADEGWHSITSTAYLKVRSPKIARIPLGVKADITREGHLGCDQRDGNKFKAIDSAAVSGDIAKQMEAMEKRESDTPAYLIPPNICGPSKWYNLTPVSPSVWTSLVDPRSQSWSNAQASLKKWRLEEGGRLELLGVVLYKDLKVPKRIKELPEGGRRPSGYAFCYRLYDRLEVIRAEAFVTLNNDT